MRVLFVSTPGVGHVFPMVPLAWALRCAGHEVLFATSGPALAAGQAGLPVIDAAPAWDRRAALTAASREHPDFVAGLRGLRGRRLSDLRDSVDYLALLSSGLVDGALDIAAGWGADLIVRSQIDGAGGVVAGRLGLPLVEHGFGLARTAGMAERLRGRLAEVFGQDADAPPRTAILDVAPPSLLACLPGDAGGDAASHSTPDGTCARWALRYVPYNGGGQLPEWTVRAPSPQDRPRVLVTLGTLEPQRGGVDALRPLIEAAGGVDAELVLALGGADTSALGPLPDRVRAVDWIPLNALLPGCAAIVHHGGAGSTLTALATGVPQLVLPSGADRYINAAAVAARGAGLASPDQTVTVEQLTRLLHDEGLRRGAEQVRAEIETMPSPHDLVPHLTELLTG